MDIATIGFTGKSAKKFFDLIKSSGIRRIVDTRAHNTSQLAGFAKRDDLAYFLRVICNVDYVVEPTLAPTAELLSAYRKKTIEWDEYAHAYVALISSRNVAAHLNASLAFGSCLLCSEASPHHCHRRLAAEYLKEAWGDVQVRHLE